MDKLLSDKELIDSLDDFIRSYNHYLNNNNFQKWDDKRNKFIDLINTQKRLFANSVIGEDEDDEHIEPHPFVSFTSRSQLRAEQRARIK